MATNQQYAFSQQYYHQNPLNPYYSDYNQYYRSTNPTHFNTERTFLNYPVNGYGHGYGQPIYSSNVTHLPMIAYNKQQPQSAYADYYGQYPIHQPRYEQKRKKRYRKKSRRHDYNNQVYYDYHYPYQPYTSYNYHYRINEGHNLPQIMDYNDHYHTHRERQDHDFSVTDLTEYSSPSIASDRDAIRLINKYSKLKHSNYY